MGCGGSTPVKEPPVASTQTKPRPSNTGDGPRAKAIDVGLTDSFEYIKPLGQVRQMRCQEEGGGGGSGSSRLHSPP